MIYMESRKVMFVCNKEVGGGEGGVVVGSRGLFPFPSPYSSLINFSYHGQTKVKSFLKDS